MPPRRPARRALKLVTKSEVERARELLGAEAIAMTDAQVMQAVKRADDLAHVIVRMFLDSESPA